MNLSPAAGYKNDEMIHLPDLIKNFRIETLNFIQSSSELKTFPLDKVTFLLFNIVFQVGLAIFPSSKYNSQFLISYSIFEMTVHLIFSLFCKFVSG